MVKEGRTRTAVARDGIKDRGCPGSPFIFVFLKVKTRVYDGEVHGFQLLPACLARSVNDCKAE